MRRFAISALLGLALQGVQNVDAQDDRGLDAWHLDNLYNLVVEQLDPIVSPNAQSSHMHRILGGSNFAAAYNYDELAASSCTTAAITVDHSSYWAPQLYWIMDPDNPSNTSFMQISSFNRFYYFLGRNDPSQPVQAWPEGFKMLAGDPNSKSPNNIYTYYCHRKADLTDEIAADNFNFDDPCIGGIKFDLTFPSCWDGINLYKPDQSHMAYPTHGLRDGACPASHPIRLPSILLEYTYHPEAFPAITKGKNMRGNLAWANGDTTGYGLHGDFMMGWDRDILTKALNDPGCVTLGYSITIQSCPVLAPYWNVGAAQNCRPARGQLTEPYPQGDGNIVPKLPGCNPLWASGPKPTCSPPVQGLDVSNFLATAGPNVLPASQQLNTTMPSGPGWHKLGCFNAALDTTIQYSDAAMTPERCQDSCKENGYSYAGLTIVGGFQCVCSNTFSKSAGITLSGCDTPCPVGDSTCGGQYRQDVYYQEAQYVGADPKAYDLGCYKLPYDWQSDNLVKGATYSFTSSSMTRDVCSQACLQKGAAYSAVRDTSCYCGPNLTTGPGFYVPNDMCTRKCGGNSSEICGDYYLMSIGNLANYDKDLVDTSPPNIGYRGCFQEGNGKLALQGFTTSSSSMTVPLCKSYCNQLGYTLAGLRNGNQCYCDSVFNGGQILPDSQCSMPCAGNATQFCGAPYILSMYNSNATTYGAEQATAAHDAGWQGCYAASLVQSKSAYADYSYSSNDMTKDFCKATCSYFGYSYAAIWAGYSCNCGNTLIATNRAPDANCNTACRGNNTQFCGGPNNIDVYQVSKANIPDNTAATAKGWLGCYANPSSGTPLSEYTYTDSKMTPALCQTACKQVANYKFSAVNGNQCTCGNTNAGTLVTPLTCKTACPGDSSQQCGGQYVASVYNTTVGTGSGSGSSSNKPAGWYGCYKEGNGYRALSSYTFSNNLMTSAMCRKGCALRGYAVSGTEYSVQCYCGNNLYSSGVLPALSCNMACGGAANETCGGSSILDVYNNTGVVITADPKTGAFGCFGDYNSLNGYKYTSSLMSASLCASTCKGKGFALSATNGGSTCMCGDATALSTLTVGADSACNTKCAGTTTNEMCGGPYMVNVYNTSIAASTGTAPGGSSFAPGYLGCYNEGSSRTLSAYTYTSNSLTNAQCIVSCGNLGFKYAGSEYASQCYCSNTIDTSTGGGILQAPTDCSMPCAGNSTEICGSAGRLSIYETAKTGLVSSGSTPSVPGLVGCYAQGGVATTGNYLFQDKSQNAQLCRLACSYKGFSNAAMQGLYCYCNAGNSQVGAIQAMALCNTPCAGNSTDNCGNAQSGAVAQYTTAGVVPVTAGMPAGYIGCFNDNPGARQLPGYSFTSANMTNLVCATTCAGRGFALSGTEAGNACYCGASLPYTLMLDNVCNSPCVGASGENCGSAYTLSVYNATQLAATAPKPSTTAVSSTVASTASGTASRTGSMTGTITSSGTLTASRTTGSASATSGAADPFATWAPRGCIADGSTRALNYTSTYAGDMTISKCAAIAKSGLFKYFGLENGGQCFVGNALAYNTTATGCNIACPGDASKSSMCGGAWRMSLFEFIPMSQAVPSTTTTASATSTSAVSTTGLASGSGSGTCPAITVTQTASATVTVTVTGNAASTSTDRIVKKRRGAAADHGGTFKKYSYIRHSR